MTCENSEFERVSYRIKLKGQLDQQWADWLESLSIKYEEGNTILDCPVVDQAALHGLLNIIRDLNLTLLSLEQMKARTSPENSS